jgi:hypothetical protein
VQPVACILCMVVQQTRERGRPAHAVARPTRLRRSCAGKAARRVLMCDDAR